MSDPTDELGDRLGDLRLRPPATLEELQGGEVVRTLDLHEWTAHLAVGRRPGCAALALALGAGLVGGAVERGWSPLLVALPLLLCAATVLFALYRKVWLVLRRGDEEVVFHVWDEGKGDEVRFAFLSRVLAAARPASGS